jgi:pseudaminic acid cytidylyltransferase
LNIAVIPARGGSKRIPRKNVKLFNGIPMLVWAISAAKTSGQFDRIIVSSDDDEIIQIAVDNGAEAPFVRPADLADDITPTVPVIAHAVNECRSLGWNAEFFCCIYPSVPLLQAGDLTRSFELITSLNCDFVYPVTEFAHPTQRAMRRLRSGRMEFIDQSNELTRTQDLEVTYHDAGQFYWGRASSWTSHKKMHSEGVGMVIPNWRVVDIDTADDWKRAELLAQVIREI